MRASFALTAALATGLTMASPIEKRQAIDDFAILNYALTLEYLERKFYMEGLANYTEAQFTAAGFVDPFYKNLKEIYFDEQTHVDFLATAIRGAGGVPVSEATYAFGVTDPKSFVTLSSVLEGVGVSAYLGAAASIANKEYLTAAGAILTVESRHSAYIRSALKQSPFPTPFDTPLGFNQVFSLAAAFITAFNPADGPLPFKPFPALPLQCTQYYYEAGRSSITFTGAAKYATHEAPYAVFFSGLEKKFVQTRVTGDNLKLSNLPEGIAGQVYVVLSKSATDASDENVVAGPAILEVYPKGKAPPNPATQC
ncbi:MAG: hypothetical protein M1817_002269 [Caeruleum heppii]|nr:MAG: hypothetical protein M1817_002269 [Caeruleum heppii]